MTVEAEAGFEHGSGEHGSVPFGLTVAGGTPGPGIANEQEKRPSGFPEPGNSARLEDGVRPEGFYDDGGLYDVSRARTLAALSLMSLCSTCHPNSGIRGASGFYQRACLPLP